MNELQRVTDQLIAAQELSEARLFELTDLQRELKRVRAELKRVRALAESRLAKIWAYARASQGRNPATLADTLQDIARTRIPDNCDCGERDFGDGIHYDTCPKVIG